MNRLFDAQASPRRRTISGRMSRTSAQPWQRRRYAIIKGLPWFVYVATAAVVVYVVVRVQNGEVVTVDLVGCCVIVAIGAIVDRMILQYNTRAAITAATAVTQATLIAQRDARHRQENTDGTLNATKAIADKFQAGSGARGGWGRADEVRRTGRAQPGHASPRAAV